MQLNIRWRLTLWITVALTVVLTCFAILVYGLLRHALFQQTDRLLAAALKQLPGDSRSNSAPDERIHYWIEEYKDHQGFYCVVYLPDGALYGRTPEMPEESVPGFRPDMRGRWVETETLPVIGRQRLMGERMRLGGRDFDVILLAPMDAIDREMGQVFSILVVAGPLTLALAAVLAYGLARKLLAPVDRIRRATDAITADRLSERLTAENSHDELGRLTHTINAMIARLERSFVEVRRFTADASHELRTPLTALRTEVEVAMNKSLSVADQQRLLGGLLEELVRMSRLTDQLLTLSRQDAGVEQISLGSLDLHTLVSDVVEALRPIADSKGLRLVFHQESPARTEGDGIRLRQVFINLLDNALKYTPEGGSVAVRIRQHERASIVTVEDSGVGISAEHLPHVFERFYRVDKARSRDMGGTGLGLSIAQSIVQAHGGTITLTSPTRGGTTCTVTLFQKFAEDRVGDGPSN